MEKFETRRRQILEQLNAGTPVLIDSGIVIEAAVQSNQAFLSKLSSYRSTLALITENQIDELRKAVGVMRNKKSTAYNPQAAASLATFIIQIGTVTKPDIQTRQKVSGLTENIPRAVVTQVLTVSNLLSNMPAIIAAWKAQKKNMDCEFMRKLINRLLDEAMLLAAVKCTKQGINQAILNNEYRKDVRNKIYFVLLELLQTCSVQTSDKVEIVAKNILHKLVTKDYTPDVFLVATAVVLNIPLEAVATDDTDVVWLHRFYLRKYAT